MWHIRTEKQKVNWDMKNAFIKSRFFGNCMKEVTRFFYKQHFYKQRQAEIGKKSSKC